MPASSLPTRAYSIDGKEVFVFDGLFSRRLVQRAFRELDDLDYQRKRNVELNDGFAEWTVSLDLAAMRKHPVVVRTVRLLADLFPGHRSSLVQSYGKSIAYGDCPYPHTDSATDHTGLVISTAYYANPEWDPAWGGETTFFDDRRDARLSIGPLPGRLLIFRGLLWHRAGVPMRNCRQARYTLISKFFAAPKAVAAKRRPEVERRLVAI